MADSIHRCSKCNGPMEQGFVLGHHDSPVAPGGSRLDTHLSFWTAGPTLESGWAAMELPREKLLPIATYRCSSCGYLESYARVEFAAQ